MSGVILLILFLILSLIIYMDINFIQTLDQLGDSVLRFETSDQLSHVFTEITAFADSGNIVFISLILVLFLFVLKKGVAATWTIGTIIMCGFVSPHLIKLLIVRERPETGLIYAHGYSFPSGHATMAVVLYGLMIIWSLIFLKSGWKKKLLTFFLSLLILFIMWSRVYLGVHYISDVIGGLLLGVGQLLISIGLYWSFQARPRG